MLVIVGGCGTYTGAGPPPPPPPPDEVDFQIAYKVTVAEDGAGRFSVSKYLIPPHVPPTEGCDVHQPSNV